jgi:hypothetical protein
MIREIAGRIGGAAIVIVWAVVVSAALGVLLASATNFAGIVW